MQPAAAMSPRLLCPAPRAHLFSASRRHQAFIIPLQNANGHGHSNSSTPLYGRRQLSATPRLRSASKKPSSPPSSSFDSSASLFSTGPAPPRLPKEEQDIFEALQRQSTGAFSTPRSPQQIDTSERSRSLPPRINQSPHSSAAEVNDAQGTIAARVETIAQRTQARNLTLDNESETPTSGQDSQTTTTSRSNSPTTTAAAAAETFQPHTIEARGTGDELHADIRRGAKPEFEGDVNPKTGEVGGPKNEPLRWGPAGEWSYNGRTTDF